MNLKLPETIASKQDISTLIAEIREYAQWFEHETIKRRMNVTELSTPPQFSTTAVRLIHDLSVEHTVTLELITQLAKELEVYAQTAPNISITLAAPITPSVKEELVRWCRENISPMTLVSFTFNTTLLGGLVVRYGSHVYDWSFRRKILDNRSRLAEVLQRV